MTREQLQDVADFLIVNGFTENEPSFFINDRCSVEFQEKGYAVANNDGYVMYSDDFEIYWLIGVLTYYNYMDKEYKIKTT